MEFLIPSVVFFIFAMFLFIKPTKIKTQISEAEAESYFFGKSELTDKRIINGVFTKGIGFYKNEKNEITAVRQAKLCDLSII